MEQSNTPRGGAWFTKRVKHPSVAITLMSILGYALSMATGYAASTTSGVTPTPGVLDTKLTGGAEEFAFVLLVMMIGLTAVSLLVIKTRPNLFRKIMNYYVGVTLFVCTLELSYIWGGFGKLGDLNLVYPGFILELAPLALAVFVVALYAFKRYSAFNVWGLLIATYLSVYLASFLQPLILFGFLAVLAVYDYLAVTKTKHMLALADAAVGEGNVLPLFIVAGGVKNLSEFSRRAKVFSSTPDSYDEPKVSALGLGDIVFPAATITSLYLTSRSMLWVFAFTGAVLGMVVNTMLLRKFKRALPAIPALAACIFVVTFMGLVILGGI